MNCKSVSWTAISATHRSLPIVREAVLGPILERDGNDMADLGKVHDIERRDVGDRWQSSVYLPGDLCLLVRRSRSGMTHADGAVSGVLVLDGVKIDIDASADADSILDAGLVPVDLWSVAPGSILAVSTITRAICAISGVTARRIYRQHGQRSAPTFSVTSKGGPGKDSTPCATSRVCVRVLSQPRLAG